MFSVTSLIAQLVKNPPAFQGTLVQFLGWEDLLEKDRLPTLIFLGFPCGSTGKESTCNVGDLGLIPGLGRSPGEGKGYPFQYSGLEKSMDCIVHWVAKESDMTEQLSPHTVNSALLVLSFTALWPFISPTMICL